MAGVGVYFSSHITELIAVLQRRGDRISVSDAVCVAPLEKAQRETREISDRLTAALHDLGQRFWAVSAAMAVGILVALALGLRKPRERILRMAGEYGGKIADIVPARRPPGLKRGIAISGFMSDGKSLRLKLPARRFANQGYGLTIGRHPALVDAVLRDGQASRRHLRIRWNGGTFEVEDINSSNGTIVNEQPLEPFRHYPLAAGDMIRVGGLELLVSKA